MIDVCQGSAAALGVAVRAYCSAVMFAFGSDARKVSFRVVHSAQRMVLGFVDLL